MGISRDIDYNEIEVISGKRSDDIQVSVFCLTYNQEQYIADALESFLQQETNFNFEIIVHDDASTDNTPMILKAYQAEFPDKITLILEKENQFSKSVNFFAKYLFSESKGRYIAFCEGDDFWTSDQKLQTQYEILESNQNIGFCVHAAHNINAETKAVISEKRPFRNNRMIKYDFLLRNVHPFATCSYFFRKDLYKEYIESDIINLEAHEDHKMGLFFGSKADVYYCSDIMSAYRVMAKGSVNSNLAALAVKERSQTEYNLLLNRIDLLNAINNETELVWNTVIQETVYEFVYGFYLAFGIDHTFIEGYYEQFKRMPLLFKIKFLLRHKVKPTIKKSFPKTYEKMKKIVRR